MSYACWYYPGTECQKDKGGSCKSCLYNELQACAEREEELSCDCCGEAINKGETYYAVNDDNYCESCMNLTFKVVRV